MVQGVKRTQRVYSLTFKLAAVDQVEKGELTYQQAQERYGIQGRSTVLVWLRMLTSRSGSTPLPFQDRGEISPGKNALLLCTTAGSTPLRLDHQSFAVHCPLALLHSAFYPVLVHRLADYAPRFLPTLGHPHAVALHFVRCDQLTAGLAPQECAHAGRTIQNARCDASGVLGTANLVKTV